MKAIKTIAAAIFVIALPFIILISINYIKTQEEPEAAYIITLNNDSISVIDPNTRKVILSEKYDSKSALAEAILKDNE